VPFGKDPRSEMKFDVHRINVPGLKVLGIGGRIALRPIDPRSGYKSYSSVRRDVGQARDPICKRNRG
jgi:hypothetical protein